MKCTQKAEKKLFFGRGLAYGGGKRVSVRNIVISVLLIVVGIAMLMLVTEGIKADGMTHIVQDLRNENGYAALLPVLLVLWAALICTEGSEGRHFRWISAVCFRS